MAKTVRVKLNQKSLIGILRSKEMEAMLLGRAKRIATQAGPGNEPTSQVGRNRARAEVVTATPQAMAAEAKDRRLSSAVHAGG
jgi:hypothetical protein